VGDDLGIEFLDRDIERVLGHINDWLRRSFPTVRTRSLRSGEVPVNYSHPSFRPVPLSNGGTGRGVPLPATRPSMSDFTTRRNLRVFCPGWVDAPMLVTLD
jgi:hypothetical protein